MPTTNYLNPASLAPAIDWKPTGAQAGRIWSERNEDYDTMMRNQMLLQDMATRENAIGLYNKTEDVPVQALERENKSIKLREEQPYLAEVTRTGAKKTIAENKFSSEITHGPQAREGTLAKIVGDIQKEKFDQTGREAQISQKLLERAMAMGPQAGTAFLQQEIERLGKAGYNIDPIITNSQIWPKLHDGIVRFNAEFRRRQLEQEQKDAAQRERDRERNATDIRRSEIAAQASRDAADRRAAGTGNKPARNAEEAAERAAAEFIAYNEDKTTDRNSDEYKDFFNYALGQVEAGFDRGPAGKAAWATIENSRDTGRLSREEKLKLYNETRRQYALVKLNKRDAPRAAPAPTPREQPGNPGQAEKDRLKKQYGITLN